MISAVKITSSLETEGFKIISNCQCLFSKVDRFRWCLQQALRSASFPHTSDRKCGTSARRLLSNPHPKAYGRAVEEQHYAIDVALPRGFEFHSRPSCVLPAHQRICGS